VVVGCSRLCGFGSDSGATGQRIRPGRIAHRTNLPFPTLENGGEHFTAVDDRLVYFACSRVPPSPTSKPPHLGGFDVPTRVYPKAGTAKPTAELKRSVPFRERLGCSVSEACAVLSVGRTFLYELIAEHRIEVIKLGRRTIVSVPSLLKLLDGQAAEPRPRRPGRPRKTDRVVAS